MKILPDYIVAVMSMINTAVILLTYWQIYQVKKATNGMKDQLIAVTRSDAKQKGITEGRAQAEGSLLT